MPVVAILSRHVPAGLGYVNADNIDGMRRLVTHLVSEGHKRIAYAGPVHASNFIDRFDGYRQGLKDAGILFDVALTATDSALRHSTESYAHALDGWLVLPKPPTAIIAANDEWAGFIALAAQARGLRIPQDLALAGFDDLPFAQTLCGGLTTVHQPFKEMGKQARSAAVAADRVGFRRRLSCGGSGFSGNSCFDTGDAFGPALTQNVITVFHPHR